MIVYIIIIVMCALGVFACAYACVVRACVRACARVLLACELNGRVRAYTHTHTSIIRLVYMPV